MRNSAPFCTLGVLLKKLVSFCEDLPDELDWEKKGLTTSVKTQGHCGACYIFSTLAAVETRCAIRNWPLRSLSVQAELDCLDDQSCVKGFQSHVYKFGNSNMTTFLPVGKLGVFAPPKSFDFRTKNMKIFYKHRIINGKFVFGLVFPILQEYFIL